jgi:NADH pyrophosphatase NudC (nudix superfamily)
MKTLKCIRPKLLISLVTVNLQSPENPTVAIWLKDKKICMNLHSTLRTATRGHASLDYWVKHGKFGHGTYSDIDWKATGKAMAKVTISRQHWVAKLSSGVCGTSKMMLRWKKRATYSCPRCLNEVEDATHVWKCQDPRAINVWTQAIANLEVWMQKQRT